MGGRGASSSIVGGNYVRFGEIPKNEQSINFLALSFSQQEDLADRLAQGQTPQEAVESLIKNNSDWRKVKPETVFEKGVSVFKADKNGNPILENIQQANSFASRLGGKDKLYNVKGKSVGTGKDGEPLLKGTKSKEQSYNKEKMENVLIDTLKKNYKDVSGKKVMTMTTVYINFGIMILNKNILYSKG